MKRVLISAALVALLAAPAHGQNGPPIYAGAGFGIGSFPHLFRANCEAPKGDHGLGPDIWAGLHFGQLRLVGRAALITDGTRGAHCSHQAQTVDTYISRTYNYISDDATLVDVRALYTFSMNDLGAAAGVHAGRINERGSRYYGGTAMLRYRYFGVAADYSRHTLEYEDTEWSAAPGMPITSREVGRGTLSMSGFFLKLFVEMTP